MIAEATVTVKAAEEEPTYEEISALAYSLWEQRGCPAGSPEEDWFKAEQELKEATLVTE